VGPAADDRWPRVRWHPRGRPAALIAIGRDRPDGRRNIVTEP